MSAGSFQKSFYQSNKTGLVHPIRIQPETLTLVVKGTTNNAPAGPADVPISAQVSQGRRSKGLNARTVTFRLLTGGPTTYKPQSPLTLPWLNDAATFDTFAEGDEVSYLGGTGEVIGTRSETAK